jgi:hypothetical protein
MMRDHFPYDIYEDRYIEGFPFAWFHVDEQKVNEKEKDDDYTKSL